MINSFMRDDVITFLTHPHYHLLNRPIFIMNKDFELLSQLEDEIDSMMIFILQKLLNPFNEKFWENN
jgi:hypothetical protein